MSDQGLDRLLILGGFLWWAGALALRLIENGGLV